MLEKTHTGPGTFWHPG